MDVNDSNFDQDDTIGSPDDVGMTNDITGAKTVKYSGASPDKPILKDAKSGKFIAGTGNSGKGGRKKGSKDRVSQAMVDLATELVANRGSELFIEMADRDPAQALALVAKIIPPEEMRHLFSEDRAETESKDTNVTISLVNAPSSPRLDSPVERIRHQPDPMADVISEAAYSASEEPSEAEQDQLDREAAEHQRALNERIRMHGGITGKPARSSAADTLPYRDDDVI